MKTKEVWNLEELEKRCIWGQDENGKPVIMGILVDPDNVEASKVRDKFMAQRGIPVDQLFGAKSKTP